MNAKVDPVSKRSTTHEYPTSSEDPLMPVLLLLEWMQDEQAVKGKLLHSIGGSPIHAKEHAAVALSRGPRRLLKFACPFDGSWRCMVSLLAPTDGFIYAPSKRNQSAQITPTRFVVATGNDFLFLAVGRGDYGGFVALTNAQAKQELSGE